MKTKHILIFLASLILATVACQTSADMSEPTRVAVIQSAQPYFATPDNWMEAPQGCFKSLTKLQYPKETTTTNGTGSIIEIVSIQWSTEKTYYIYYISTATHFILNNNISTGSTVKISAGFQDQVYFDYKVVDHTIIFDNNGTETDGSLIAVIGESIAISPLNESPSPISADKLASGAQLSENEAYYSFGYPNGSWLPQFSKSKVINLPPDPHYLYKVFTMETIDDKYGAINLGYSGGPLCNQNDQIVGIVIDIPENYKRYNVVPLPNNIRDQYTTFKNKIANIVKAP